MYLYMTFVLSKRHQTQGSFEPLHSLSLFSSDIVLHLEYKSELTSSIVKGCTHIEERTGPCVKGQEYFVTTKQYFIFGLEWIYYYTMCTYGDIPFV